MRSVSGSGSRRAPLLAVVAVVLLASGCDALRVDPGGEFGVRVLDQTPIPATGKISVPVRIAVTGCDAFGAAVRTDDYGSHPVDVVREGEGWVANVPVEWVRAGDDGCLRGASATVPRSARLDVTCADVGRTASAPFEISYATADVVIDRVNGLVSSSLEFLYPGADPLEPYALSPSDREHSAWLHPLTGVPFEMKPFASLDPLRAPRLASQGSSVFLTVGCPDAPCPPLEVAPDVVVATEEVLKVSPDGGAPGALSVTMVPSEIVDVGFAADGALVVVSDVWFADASTGGFSEATVVTRVVPDAPPETVGVFLAERVMSALSRTSDGRLAFLTYRFPASEGPLTAVLSTTDGRAIERVSDAAAGTGVGWSSGPGGSLTGTLLLVSQLAPDASALLVGARFLGPPGANAWVELPADDLPSGFGVSGAAWGPDTIARWSDLRLGDPGVPGRVEGFERSPPHARRFRYDVERLPGSDTPARLDGAVAVGEHFVLTTNTGVRVLDRSGEVVAGSDPLPCRMSPSTPAIQSGPHHAAVGVGDSVLVFDLSPR